MIFFSKFKPEPKPQTTAELVQEIHDTFFTEVDRLLEEAQRLAQADIDQEALDRKQRLEKLGFEKSAPAVSAREEADKARQVEQENDRKRHTREAIEYFSHKYPQYKFITEESVKRICEQYGLVYGSSKNYIGDVPEKNIREMENFQIDEEDKCWVEISQLTVYSTPYKSTSKKYISKQDAETLIGNGEASRQRIQEYEFGRSVHDWEQAPLEIAAPPSDFDMTGMELSGQKIQKAPIPDPVVLQPVHYNDRNYYLIVTAWGPEASDPEVVNEKNN